MTGPHNSILKSPSAWRYAVLEHLVCWVHRENYIEGNINKIHETKYFWQVFLYYYNLSRNFKRGENDENIKKVFEIFETAKIPQSDSDFFRGVRLICERVLSLDDQIVRPHEKIGGPKSAASKVLFNKNPYFGFIFDSRASKSLKSIRKNIPISKISVGFDFDVFYEEYAKQFFPVRDLMQGILDDYGLIPGMTAGRIVDKLLYLGGGSLIEESERILDSSAALVMFESCNEAATEVGAKISKIFEETL
ncbi:hypothetical protein [Roseixanthobacter pseudopolyaromaticivorans]|uniref:hypothetical protein n=1 Tax=Xanthobacteraceae TaxID=335928 RepID=UPI003729B6B7